MMPNPMQGMSSLMVVAITIMGIMLVSHDYWQCGVPHKPSEIRLF